MSIWDHDSEVSRLLGSPKGTKVWAKDITGKWNLLDDDLLWLSDVIYIVDDRHAEMRKEWIDRGKPPVQFYDDLFEDIWKDTDNPGWELNLDYRFKDEIEDEHLGALRDERL